LCTNIDFLNSIKYRLEKDATARDSLLLMTKQSHDDTIKELLEVQERNLELMNGVEDSNKKIMLLEDSVKRFSLFAFKYL
jgi:myosin-5